MANLPTWGYGNSKYFQKALDAKLLDRHDWIYSTDKEQFGFIDTNKNIVFVGGLNFAQIKFVDVLPSEEDGETNTLYICGKILYFFDGSYYHQVGDNVTVEGNIATADEVRDALNGKSYDGSNLLTLEDGLVIADYIKDELSDLIDAKITAQVEELVNAEVTNAINKLTASDISYDDGTIADALDNLQVATDEEIAEMLKEEYGDETGGEP